MFFFQALSGMASKVPFTEDRVALAGGKNGFKGNSTIFSSAAFRHLGAGASLLPARGRLLRCHWLL